MNEEAGGEVHAAASESWFDLTGNWHHGQCVLNSTQAKHQVGSALTNTRDWMATWLKSSGQAQV